MTVTKYNEIQETIEALKSALDRVAGETPINGCVTHRSILAQLEAAQAHIIRAAEIAEKATSYKEAY